ncbi:MAG: hypothetical protein VX768_06645 [Planctomycetota bacterium]|nr:hypothetical protein [Planctomycetota bacterium]
MKNLVALLAICTTFAFVQNASAHSAFKKAFEAKYKVKASCTACHDKKSKEIRNDFGKLYDKALEGKDITKKWKAAKEEGSAERKKYEAGEMTTEFKKAMEVVGKMKKDDKTYADLIKELKIEGLKAKS